MAVRHSRFVELQASALFLVGIFVPIFISQLRSSCYSLAIYYIALVLYVRYHKAGNLPFAIDLLFELAS
jgi:hypothetical protein